MKKTLPVLLLFAALVYLLPLAPFLAARRDSPSAAPAESASPLPASSFGAPSAGSGAGPAPLAAEEPLLILDEVTGQVMTVPVADFVLGAVAAEMPLTWPDEALRAQAVASHSYALAVKAQVLADDSPDPALQGAYFSAAPSLRMGFLTDEMMRLAWGTEYEASLARLKSAVEPVLEQILTYQGAPALACYHACSNGATLAAEDVWGAPVPYLTGVDSAWDLENPELEQTITLTSQEVYEALSQNFAGMDLSVPPDQWFGAFQRSGAGYVRTVQIGGVTCKGLDVRTALGLRSTDFTITWQGTAFSVTTRGYGHGVGLSQYGARAMAEQGSTYDQILAHYYPGTQLGAAA